jgi:pimeloyl-ACP methyl ester carboxylesterase
LFEVPSRQFPGVPEHQWEDVARQWFNDDHGRPTNAYDQNLGRSMSLLDSEVPTLWPQFESITKLPTLVLRGEHSDILSEATVREMRLRHPKLEAITVPGQGHAPLLRDRQTIAAVADFLATTDPAPAT